MFEGSYIVRYHNPEENRPYFKAIWWDGKRWRGWRITGWAAADASLNHLVYEFYPESWAEYYSLAVDFANK